jgi:multisubunit Na+/H+ antiporter MnhF subunit
VNIWLAATIPLLLGLIPCGIVALRGTAIDALVALELATILCVLALLTIEQGLARPSFFDLSLALAVLAVPSTLLFARFYRRWL